MTEKDRADLKALEIKLLKYLNWAENGTYEEPKRSDYSGTTIRELLEKDMKEMGYTEEAEHRSPETRNNES